jgi:GTP cyclohydrolase I
MRSFSFILLLTFAFSLMGDCCPSSEGLDSTVVRLSQACDDVTETEHSSSSEHTCHCPSSCQVKVFFKGDRKLLVNTDIALISFPDHHLIYESLDPLQIFHPPIV